MTYSFGKDLLCRDREFGSNGFLVDLLVDLFISLFVDLC